MSYEGERNYLLTLEDGLTTRASGHLRQEGGMEAPSLKLEGVLQDSQVSANVAVVGDVVHIFTKAIVCLFEHVYTLVRTM